MFVPQTILMIKNQVPSLLCNHFFFILHCFHQYFKSKQSYQMYILILTDIINVSLFPHHVLTAKPIQMKLSTRVNHDLDQDMGYFSFKKCVHLGLILTFTRTNLLAEASILYRYDCPVISDRRYVTLTLTSPRSRIVTHVEGRGDDFRRRIILQRNIRIFIHISYGSSLLYLAYVSPREYYDVFL